MVFLVFPIVAAAIGAGTAALASKIHVNVDANGDRMDQRFNRELVLKERLEQMQARSNYGRGGGQRGSDVDECRD